MALIKEKPGADRLGLMVPFVAVVVTNPFSVLFSEAGGEVTFLAQGGKQRRLVGGGQVG